MIANNRIKVQLKSELQMAIIDLKETTDVDRLTDILKDLDAYDFEEFKIQLTTEIKNNLKSVWTNKVNGINKSQKLDAFLFEHFTPHSQNTEALAYGIINWEEKDIDGVEVDLGFDYGFAEDLEQEKGLTLNYFDPYVNNKEALELDEYHLLECFKIKGLIAMHEVLAELDDKEELKAIHKNKEFCFLVSEHDTSCHLVYSMVD